MSLQALIKPVLPHFPAVNPDMEVEVLHDLPVETLFLALKQSDAETALWFFENALPEQVQGLIDVDCWQGSEFSPERAELYFKTLTLLSPPKLLRHMNGLDPEYVVLTLMNLCEVQDYDPREPTDLPDGSYMLSPDSKYILILKTESPDAREALYQWLNRLSAASLDVMRRHLESCKWEQISDLEEHGYEVKRGRLEDMGFVDYHEALRLYARGNAADLKKQLLENPLSKELKKNDAQESIADEWLPVALAAPLNGQGFLASALAEVKDEALKNVLLQEILRTLNAALAADKALQEEIEVIAHSSARARRYMDLGLQYLADGRPTPGGRVLETQPLMEVLRLGWLVVQDLARAGQQLSSGRSADFFGPADALILAGLQGRHPELDRQALTDLDLPQTPGLLSLEAILKVGAHLAQLGLLKKFFVDDLAPTLRWAQQAPATGESYWSRLLTALFRQASIVDAEAALSVDALSPKDWAALTPNFKPEIFTKALALVEGRCPEAARPLFRKRAQSLQEDVLFYVRSSPAKLPDGRFFKGLNLRKDA
jgi:hypothetical protein